MPALATQLVIQWLGAQSPAGHVEAHRSMEQRRTAEAAAAWAQSAYLDFVTWGQAYSDGDWQSQVDRLQVEYSQCQGWADRTHLAVERVQ